ncbi:MAG: glycosyltransferase family 9 protein [Candidatus Eremiobacteraeota bacterium]|nr:glycosyltransferase family 9 protein [Candidatus Eremiobacteraeota bacterium]
MKKEEIIYQTVRKILHIRLDRLGDVILSTPLLRALYDNWKDKEVHALVTPYTREVLEECPYVSEIKVFSNKWSIGERLSFLNHLKKEEYDLVIAHSPTSFSYFTAFFTKAQHRIGYVYEERPIVAKLVKMALTDPIMLDIRSRLAAGEKIPHEVEQGLMIAEKLGLKIKSRDLYLKPTDKDFKHVDKMMEKWFWTNKKIFGIHLSNKWLALGWEVKHFHRLVNEIQRKWKGSYVLFTYGSYEIDIGREIHDYYKNKTTVHAVWDLSIKQWAAMLKKCTFLITTDTGAVHVAASQKVPVIVIYHPDNYELNSRQWAPWRVKNKKLVQKSPVQLINEIVNTISELEHMY